MIRRIVLLALALLIAACMVPAVPSAPLPVSPLPAPPLQAMSPLPLPGRMGAPTVVTVSKAYLPVALSPVVASFLPCAQNATALRMALIFATAEWQRRINPRCDPLLALAAQRKVEDMLRYRYFGHIMHSGATANENVQATGYVLPPFYVLENNVESLALNQATPELLFVAWQTSPLHWRHIAGLDPFFALQTCFGTGYVEGPEDAGKYYAVISAPCPEAVQ